MNLWLLTATILSAIALTTGIVYFLFKRALDHISKMPMLDVSSPSVCYRCADPAVCQHMGISYCFMCRQVVVMMSSAVSFDPPYGFPGAPGYLEAPKQLLEAKANLESTEEGDDRG